ncbi:Trimethylguanosine synthase [Blyttiomyces sp. JEL0837]|nr:Trimethylguanosine synthase [Blyttiomyces sp. JEL0837]
MKRSRRSRKRKRTDSDDPDAFRANVDAPEKKSKVVVSSNSIDDRALQDRCLTWTKANMPDELGKYWFQRYSLFSRFDDGVKMDYGRFHSEVIAIDIDPVKIECARHNARIYGVEDKIEFILGDFIKLAPQLEGDVVFLSPPWGGPAYLKEKVFDLKNMLPIDGIELFKIAAKITPNIVYYVPRNVSQDQMVELAGPGGVCELEETYLNDRPKVLTSYYGNMVKQNASEDDNDYA